MKGRKWGIGVLTVLLAAASVWLWAGEPEQPIYYAQAQSAREAIYPQQLSSGTRALFLPSFGNLADLKPRDLADPSVLDQGLRPGRPYPCKDGSTMVFYQGMKVPALFLDTESGTVEQIHQSKEHRESGQLRLYTPEGQLQYAGALNWIKARGNTTFLLPEKKSYSLELDTAGDLLDMGIGEKWVLLANALDASHIRNKLVYDFAAEFGLAYSPESRWVDLYLNGRYAGLYLLAEKNEIHPSRVDISGEGSFLVSCELEQRLVEQQIPHIVLPSGVALRLHGGQMPQQALAQLWQQAENAIFAADGVDPVTGKSRWELLDLDSWARKYLIEEFFGNYDGGRYSAFFYRDSAQGKIMAGPVWDYDYAMANPELFEGLSANMLTVNQSPQQGGSPWFSQLYKDETFRTYVQDLYSQEFVPLLETLIEETIPQYAIYLGQSVHQNQLLWDTLPAGSQVDAIREYLRQRQVFFDKIWLENQEYSLVFLECKGIKGNYGVFPGEDLSFLPQEPGFGWFCRDTGEPVNIYLPVFQDAQWVYRQISQEGKEA